MKKILILGIIASNLAIAKNPIKLKEFYVEAEKSVMSNRNLALPKNETKKGELNAGFKLRFRFSRDFEGYSDTKIQSIFTERQFRNVGLGLETGIEYKQGIDFFYRHYSGHSLDFQPNMRFEEDNSVGVRFKWKF